MEARDIHNTIQIAIDQLDSTFEGNAEKTREIIALFIEETPSLLAELREKAETGQYLEAATLAHKVKSRYGYFGFDQITKELGCWEDNLQRNKSIDFRSLTIDDIETITAQIIAELKKDQPINPSHNNSARARFHNKCVLVAEDDDINAMIIELFLKEMGIRSVRVTDGFEAISKTVDQKPDLILMDVHMPYCSGLDAIRGIRKKGIKTTIVSLSAASRHNEREESLRAGGDDFLMKPANRQSILEIITKHLVPN